MYERNTNRRLYYEEQKYTTRKFVIPYISEVRHIPPGSAVLEIGCGEGGNLAPFVEMGCNVVGIDYNEAKIQKAKEFLKNDMLAEKVQLISSDIYKIEADTLPKFDLIIVRDVIEHIQNQEKFLFFVQQFLQINGSLFVAFPPWRMPFGGHQQICKSFFWSKTPYFHLLPKCMVKAIFQWSGESQYQIDEMLTLRKTKISVSRYRKLLKSAGYKIERETCYFINPNYEVKFNMKPRVLPKFLHIPFLQDFYTTAHYSVISMCGNDDFKTNFRFDTQQRR